MRCEHIENLLNEHADAALTPAQRDDVDAHLATCDDCSTAWRAAFVLRGHRGLPTPHASAAQIARIAATRQPIGVKKRLSPWVAAEALSSAEASIASGAARGADDQDFSRGSL